MNIIVGALFFALLALPFLVAGLLFGGDGIVILLLLVIAVPTITVLCYSVGEEIRDWLS